MIVLGADPGVTGALAIVDLRAASLVSAIDMPVIRYETKTRLAVDPRGVAAWLEEVGQMPEHIVIEHQQPFGEGRQGISSAFVLGVMFGSVCSVMAGYGIPISFTVPAQWKRQAGLLGKDKAAALFLARQRFGLAPDLTIARGQVNQEQAIARSDAALIGWYGLPRQMQAQKASIKPPKPAITKARARPLRPAPLLDGV